MKICRPTLAIMTTLLISASVASAQTPTASVVGRVTDASGAVLPGVTIAITNPDTSRSSEAVTNANGDYTILFLNPSRYVLEASLAGFRNYKRSAFTLEVEQTLRLDIRMELGAITETVNVTEAAPLLNTETATRGDVTTKAEIAELPLADRSFANLAFLTGSVTPKTDGADGAFAVNGARADNAGFLLDGMNNTQRRNTNALMNPSVEGVQEFKMMTSGFSAEYGRYAGGMLSVVTKSGTNKFRGSVFEFMRNDALDAKGYFDPVKSDMSRHQFGATIGGPLVIPGLYNGRNRTFFMATWESLRSTAGQTQLQLVPTQAMLKGDFSGLTDKTGKPIVITDPLTKLPFPNNQIPPNRLNSVAINLAKYFPEPTLTGDSLYNYAATGTGTDNYDNFGIKIDQALGSTDRLTGSFFYRPSDSCDPLGNKGQLPYFGTCNPTLQLLTYAKYLKMISSSMFLEVTGNFSRRTNNEHWPESGTKDWAAETGFYGTTTDPLASGPPNTSITGYATIGVINAAPKIWEYENRQITGNLTYVRGKHNMKTGVDFLRYDYLNDAWNDTRGRVVAQGSWTGQPVADFMLGYLQSTRRAMGPAGPHDRVYNFSAYFQDDFKPTSSLTLNLGLRYDRFNQPVEVRGAMANYIPEYGKVVAAGYGELTPEQFTSSIASVGLTPYVVMASDVGLPKSIVKPDNNDFAPRIGFAWRLGDKSTTVVRGGYGIFYGTDSLYRMDDYSQVFPYAITQTFSRLTSDPTVLTLSNPWPISRVGYAGVTSSYGRTTTSPKTQYLQSWNLAVEREVSRGTTVELAYAGSKGTFLPRRYDINQPSLDPSAVRPNPAFGSIMVISNASNSIYHSGQVTLRQRVGNQLFIRASYTYAKSLDESSNTGGVLQYNFPQAQNPNDLHAEWGRSDFDMRHAFAGSVIWTPQWTHWLARDWQVASTWQIYSGLPFTPKVATSNVSGVTFRPDRIGAGAVANPSANMWYNIADFPIVPAGAYRFGNSGRNILSGPGTTQINASVSKRFRFGGTKALQVRVEAFNLPNVVNLGLPENNVDLSTAGAIRSEKGMRTMQIGLRFEF
jgi:hypothetical protein